MSMITEQNAFLRDVRALLEFIQDHLGVLVTGGELWRNEQTQRFYRKVGLSHTLHSFHRDRLAIDLNLFDLDGLAVNIQTWGDAGEYWKSLSPLNSWGGDFIKLRDYGHFERHYVAPAPLLEETKVAAETASKNEEG